MADNDFTEIEDLVRRDIQAGLAGDRGKFRAPFAPRISGDNVDGIQYANAITGGAFTAVEWAFDAQHIESFGGIPATNREVTIHGVTIVRQRGDNTTFRRYVDWAGLMSDLGVTASFRPAFEKMEEIPNIRLERTESRSKRKGKGKRVSS
jgi:hypothetical protein